MLNDVSSTFRSYCTYEQSCVSVLESVPDKAEMFHFKEHSSSCTVVINFLRCINEFHIIQ